MEENKKENSGKEQRLKGNLLDDQFKDDIIANKFLICADNEDANKNDQTASKENRVPQKPIIDKSLLSSFSTNKYKNFLIQIQKDKTDINENNAKNMRIDNNIFEEPNEEDKEGCVLMDVSMGLFEVNNELSDSKIKEMNITVAEVAEPTKSDSGNKSLIQEI